MLPEKTAFILYKAISNHQVCMGNNSFIPVLGRGTAIFSLDGQYVFIQTVLRVPGLVLPLYSLRTHLTQSGCVFYEACEAGILVCFLIVVLTVDKSSDCHLSYEPLDVAHHRISFIMSKLRCLPTLYPSTMASSTPFLCSLPCSGAYNDRG